MVDLPLSAGAWLPGVYLSGPPPLTPSAHQLDGLLCLLLGRGCTSDVRAMKHSPNFCRNQTKCSKWQIKNMNAGTRTQPGEPEGQGADEEPEPAAWLPKKLTLVNHNPVPLTL